MAGRPRRALIARPSDQTRQRASTDGSQSERAARTAPSRRARGVRQERRVEQAVSSRPARLYHEVYGEGPPVVLVHGLCGSTRWWGRNVEALSRRHRVIAVDLAGFGESTGRFVLSEAAALLRSFLRELGVSRPDLIGHSMGGLIAAELAADFPEAVRKLVLVDAAGVPFQHGFLTQAMSMARAAGQIPLDLYPVLLGDTGRAGVLQVVRLARELLDADVSEKLGSITAPTLVVWGADDLIVPLSLGRALAERIPQAQLAVLPGTGHIPMWERPEEWNELVLPFLEAE